MFKDAGKLVKGVLQLGVGVTVILLPIPFVNITGVPAIYFGLSNISEGVFGGPSGKGEGTKEPPYKL